MSADDIKARDTFAEYKQRATQKLTRFLMSIAPTEKKRVFLSSGWKSFTVEEMLREIEEETEYGKDFVQMFGKPREEFPAREAE